MATGAADPSPVISLQNNDDDNLDRSEGDDFETNRRYLTFSWWLLHRGWRSVMLNVREAVESVFGPIRVTSQMDIQRFSELILEVRKRVEGETERERREKKWLEHMLPPREDEELILKESGVSIELDPASPSSKALRRSLDETADLIESPAFAHVLTLLLDAGFSTLVEVKLAEQAFAGAASSKEGGVKSARVKLPKILAPLMHQAPEIGRDVANEYVQAMEQVRDLEAFAAVVYSSNWEIDMRPTSRQSANPVVKGAYAALSTEGETGQESFIDVGTARAFESAWGKASEQSS